MTDIISGALPALHVRITVALDCGHVLHYTDTIAEKYPLHCEACEATPTGKYPWVLTAEVTAAGMTAQTIEDVARIFYEAGYDHGQIGGMAAAARPCECGHPAGSHWEASEPGGDRRGCGVLGCECEAYAG